MKNKFTKRQDFKIRDSNPDDGICKCANDGIISEHCLKIGICPSLRIVGVYRGVEIKYGVTEMEKQIIGKQNKRNSAIG